MLMRNKVSKTNDFECMGGALFGLVWLSFFGGLLLLLLLLFVCF